MFTQRRARYAALALAAFFGLSAAAQAAETHWDRDHLRRDPVHERLAQQDARIRQERHEHELSVARAQAMRRHEEAIRSEQRRMAFRDEGHPMWNHWDHSAGR